MTRLEGVSYGFDLAMKLCKFAKDECLGPACVVYFGVQDHLFGGDPWPGLAEMDTWATKWLCSATLKQLGEHMVKLSGHDVFSCGRSFYFEGFDIAEKWSDNYRNLQTKATSESLLQPCAASEALAQVALVQTVTVTCKPKQRAQSSRALVQMGKLVKEIKRKRFLGFV